MKNEAMTPEIEQRLRGLEKAIAKNERRQQRLRLAMERGKTVKKLQNNNQSDAQESVAFNDPQVTFTRENALIFMSGNLEEPDVRHVTPSERRNRLVLLLVLAAAILIGFGYMFLF